MALNSSPVDEIKERLDIVEVLSEYVKLLPAGPSRYKVLCPFHNEKTPSLMVSKDRQAWHCFGCGKGGDMFTFVQEIEGVEFAEALRILAKKAKVELRPADPKLHSAKTKLYDLLKLSAAFYRKVFTDAPAGQTARQYVQSRGILEETGEEWQLGYSPTSWDGLLNFLVKKGFSEQDVFDAGLTVKRDKGVGYYDRFRGRLMFPIRDVNGTVVGFGGRILETADGDASPPTGSGAAKYINSPETLVYSKSRVLFGLDRAKQAIKQADLAVLVEGYMDCLASHQTGVKNVVAVSGTALTSQQVKLLKRYTNNAALAFDADLAGGQASNRGIDQALAADMRVTVITMPPGVKDPDELIRRDPAEWRNAIGRAERIVDNAFNRAFGHADLTQVEEKKRMARLLLPVIAKLPDPVEQSHYLQLLSSKLKIDEEALRLSLRRLPGEKKEVDEDLLVTSLPTDRSTVLAERLLALAIFSDQNLFHDLIELLDPKVLADSELQALYKQAILYYNETHQIDRQGFSARLTKELPLIGSRVSKLTFLAERDFSDVNEKDARRELKESVRHLRRQNVAAELRGIEGKLRQAEASNNGQAADDLLRRINELTDELRSLEA